MWISQHVITTCILLNVYVMKKHCRSIKAFKQVPHSQVPVGYDKQIYNTSIHMCIPEVQWKSNYIHYEIWNGIIYPFPNFNGAIVKVWEWIRNFIPHLIGSIITYPCLWTMLIKGAPDLPKSGGTSCQPVTKVTCYIDPDGTPTSLSNCAIV